MLTSFFYSVTGMSSYFEENEPRVREDEWKKAALGVVSRGVGLGNLKLAGHGRTSTWQVEVETKIGEEAKVSLLLIVVSFSREKTATHYPCCAQFEYNKWYRLYNKERNRYLSAQVISGDGWRYINFCHSDKAKATFFKFENRDRTTGSVRTGDKGLVEAFSASKGELGRLCVSKYRQGGISLDITANDTLPGELWHCLFQFEVL